MKRIPVREEKHGSLLVICLQVHNRLHQGEENNLFSTSVTGKKKNDKHTLQEEIFRSTV